jgi:hypothetical protein
MKNILLLILCFVFAVGFSQQKKSRKAKHDRDKITIVKSGKDSVTFERKNSKRTIYQTNKKFYSFESGDSAVQFNFKKKKPK